MPHDLILVGGGLANCLIAARVKAARPETSILVVEASDRLGGNHTWSFQDTDIGDTQRRWVEPLVVHAWPAHDVIFPAYTRRLEARYCSITSARLREWTMAVPGLDFVFGHASVGLSRDEVRLDDGRVFPAKAVIDGRGGVTGGSFSLRYQKFLGQEVTVREPHGLRHPRLMDATVEQLDGFRFVYVLPLDPCRLLIEDTYYADTPALDPAVTRARIADYSRRSGWTISHVLREETGSLPIVLNGDVDEMWKSVPPGVACAGVRAALFHPTTGYSLPDAVRLAGMIAAAPDISGDALARLTRAESRAHWRRHGFSRLLNRLLFIAAKPREPIGVMQRFYALPAGMIARFYAGRTRWYDRLRILSGRPPVNIFRAIASLPPRSARRAPRGGAT